MNNTSESLVESSRPDGGLPLYKLWLIDRKVITNVIIRVVPRIQESFVPLWMGLFLYFIGGVYGRKRIIRKER